MIISSYTRSKESLTVYSEAGEYKSLKPTDYEIPKIIAALSHLTATGEPVEIDLSRFEIVKALKEVAPEATIVSDNKNGISLRYDDLDIVIRDAKRLEHHLRRVANDPTQIGSMRAFLANCAASKRSHSVDELLDFISQNELPITKDGMVLCWKYVIKNPSYQIGGPLKDAAYVDCYSTNVDRKAKSYDNSIGKIVFTDAANVDPNRLIDCSHGLHVCSKKYLNSVGHGNPLILVKVHPAHFIAVPHDYNHTKARVCAYLVLDDTAQSPTKEQIDRFVNFPASVHIDGHSLDITEPVDPKDTDLIDMMRRLNPPIADGAFKSSTPAPATKAQNKKMPSRLEPKENPAPTTTKVATEPHNEATWYSFDELAEFTGKTKSAIRGAASGYNWKKRLAKSGLIETIPDPQFTKKHITGWFSMRDLMATFAFSQQKIVAIATSNAWPQRRNGSKELQMQPPSDYAPVISALIKNPDKTGK